MSSPIRSFSRLAAPPSSAAPTEGVDTLAPERPDRVSASGTVVGTVATVEGLRPRAERARIDPDAVRARIVEVAEEQFRRVGYAKTAVADIAAVLGMSAANVYRYFPSKLAINEAICARLMDQTHEMVAAIVRADEPAEARLRRLVLEVHRTNKARMIGERRMYDMVAVAMEESWDSIEAHIATMEGFFGELIADGIRRGEFREVDVARTAPTVLDCCLVVFHPTLLAQCAHHDQDAEAHRLVDFLLLALKR